MGILLNSFFKTAEVALAGKGANPDEDAPAVDVGSAIEVPLGPAGAGAMRTSSSSSSEPSSPSTAMPSWVDTALEVEGVGLGSGARFEEETREMAG